MSQYPSHPDASISGVAPPVTAGPLGNVVKPIVWPTVIGVIAIVFGSGGVAGGFLGIFAPLLISFFKDFIDKLNLKGQPNPLASMASMGWWVSVMSGVGMLIAGLLLFAGIRLMKRRPNAAMLMVTWAIVKMLFAVPMLIGNWYVQHEQMSGMFAGATSPSGGPAVPPAVVSLVSTVMPLVGVVFGLAWAWALPVFIVIWFRRARVREHVATWRVMDQGAGKGL